MIKQAFLWLVRTTLGLLLSWFYFYGLVTTIIVLLVFLHNFTTGFGSTASMVVLNLIVFSFITSLTASWGMDIIIVV